MECMSNSLYCSSFVSFVARPFYLGMLDNLFLSETSFCSPDRRCVVIREGINKPEVTGVQSKPESILSVHYEHTNL
uniref:Uncharacterized protein n=1 Tax=Arundo donax TaxID=35708 RepID=A0A0A9GHC4_ARUDO